MKIKLSEFGPAMWFLGEPRKLIISLTFANPGPVEVDFDKLQPVDQAKLLKSIREGVVESDVPFRTLYERWAEGNVLAGSTSTKEVAQIQPGPADPRLVWAQQIEAKRNALQAQRDEEEAHVLERCKYLSGLTVRGLKSSLKRENDIKLLRALLKTEEAGKGRKLVLEAIHEKIREHDHGLALEIMKLTKEQLAGPGVGIPKDKMGYTVEESDLETVTLTPEDLIKAAAKEL